PLFTIPAGVFVDRHGSALLSGRPGSRMMFEKIEYRVPGDLAAPALHEPHFIQRFPHTVAASQIGDLLSAGDQPRVDAALVTMILHRREQRIGCELFSRCL